MMLTINRIAWNLFVILFIHFPLTLSIEHDSICDLANEPKCAPVSHTVMRISKRDNLAAKRIAESHGMEIVGRPFLDGTAYFIRHKEERSSRHKREIISKIQDHPDVVLVEEQRPRRRVKRDFIHTDVKRVTTGSVQNLVENNKIIPHLPFQDPLFHKQWYFNNGAHGGYDMNVHGAWLMGYAGRNVSISILDDGIQRDHPDLEQNYDPLASTDINGDDDDPTPQDNGDNKHGTRCAGEVAAVAGNQYCGVGVAFLSKIGGVRMLDGVVSDGVEAASLSLRQDHIDIYSASWGPEDDGKTFDGPGPMAREAFYNGVKFGRGGKGNIFVWASGNGGSRQDSCSADGYTTSVYTLSISSATFDNRRPWYLEECPSTIATTYSSANMGQPAIVTVDVPNGCTTSHTGTSASAPLAAGIIALALEANPNLTWRDMQHIVLRTANPVPLLSNPGWSLNGVGRKISNKFGYGLMDATALVKLAQVWKTVPEQHVCTYDYALKNSKPRPLTGRFKINFTLEVSGCEGGTPVLYLEHVQVYATIRFGKRGDLKLTLLSPRGTTSVLLPPRPQDTNKTGFHRWPFLTVQMWGEDPRGIWTLVVESVSANRNVGGTFHDWSLMLYGTADPAQPNDTRHVAGSFPSNNFSKVIQGAATRITSQEEFVQNQPSPDSLAIGDLHMASDCHEECIGCSESRSAASCYSCKHLTQSLRNRAGFKCVSRCDEGYFVEGDKCRICSSNCKSCVNAEQCSTCPGALLLIDVDHYGHLDHGMCVKSCPEEMEADYTRAVQARCILKKNRCSVGYYEAMNLQCLVCDEACSSCHGSGPLQCDSCAQDYSNRSVGYCRPCCSTDQNPTDHHCEDCSLSDKEWKAKYSKHHSFISSSFFLSLVSLIVLAVIIAFIYKVAVACSGNSNIDYTPLPTQDSKVDVESPETDDSDTELIEIKTPGQDEQLIL